MAGHPPQYIPPPPPPPPPGYGEGGFGNKPTSGMAIGSLICGLVGMISFFCWPLAITSLVGLALGIAALVSTGREGKRSGRGLAIAGTIVSVLSVGVMVTSLGLFFFMMKQGTEQMNDAIAGQLDGDQRVILERLKKYYSENDKSLGPGGPVLAGAAGYNSGPSNRAAGNEAPVDTRQRVSGALELRHLVGENELIYGSTTSGGGAGWELTVTGMASATLRAKGWGGDIMREIAIQDIGMDQYVQTLP